VQGTYFREAENGKKIYFNPSAVDVETDDKGRVVPRGLTSDGQPVQIGAGREMSKSKNNGIDPQTLIDKYGADTVRLYTMFAAPPEQSLEWSDSAVEGAYRFLRGLWRMVHEHTSQGPAPAPAAVELDHELRALRRRVHETIAKVTDDIARRYKFNTAIAAVMELVNALQKANARDPATRAVRQEGLETCVLLLAPIVPHCTEALWRRWGIRQARCSTPAGPRRMNVPGPRRGRNRRADQWQEAVGRRSRRRSRRRRGRGRRTRRCECQPASGGQDCTQGGGDSGRLVNIVAT